MPTCSAQISTRARRPGRLRGRPGRRRRRGRCPLGAQTTEHRPGVKLGGLGGEPVERAAGGERTRVSWAAGTPTAPGPSTLRSKADDRVTELARGAGRAAVDPPAEDEAAADAGPDREHHQVVGDRPQLLVVGLGQRRDGRVVVDEHGHARAESPRSWRNGRSASGTLTDETTRPVSNSTTEGTPIPTALTSPDPHALDELDELVDSAVALERLVGSTNESPSWPSTAARAATFVPPRSMPTTSLIAARPRRHRAGRPPRRPRPRPSRRARAGRAEPPARTPPRRPRPSRRR